MHVFGLLAGGGGWGRVGVSVPEEIFIAKIVLVEIHHSYLIRWYDIRILENCVLVMAYNYIW